MDVLSQLQAVDTELSAQEKQLTSQLAALQEKIKGIHTVIALYSASEEGSSEPATEVSAPVSAEPEETAAVEKPTESAKPKAKKTTRKKTAKKVSTTSTKKKKDGRTAPWQKYTRPGVKNESLPDAVRLILETQPTKDFKIAEVMDALFKEGMPKNQYLKARNRISNVLSGGVRAGDWHKGERGSYRMTAA